MSDKNRALQLWIAWHEDVQYVAAILGTAQTREQMERVIDTANHERGKASGLRPVRITVHVEEL
jgi:hypothetical protein